MRAYELREVQAWNVNRIEVVPGEHNLSSHQGGRDVIPPGWYDTNGRNWGDTSQAFIDNGCAGTPPPPLSSLPAGKATASVTPTCVSLDVTVSAYPAGSTVLTYIGNVQEPTRTPTRSMRRAISPAASRGRARNSSAGWW